MLSTMREKTRVIMLVLAVAFVGWLVFDVGMGGTGQSPVAQDVGSVNGKPITITAWNEAYRVAYEEVRQQNPGLVLTREEQRQIEDEAFSRLVTNELLKEEYARRGIRVTDAEIADAVRRFPPQALMQAPDFQTEGRFDPTKYQRFLASNNEQTREYLLAMEAQWRTDLPRFKLFQEVTGDVFVPESKLWQMWRDQHDSARVRMLVIRPDIAVADASVRATDEEVRDYYDEHRDEFSRPARARVSFLAIVKLPTPEDSVLIMARARTLRDSILRGASFEEIARAESQDTASRDSAGLLGTFERGRMVPPFDRAVWSQPLGQIGEPVATAFGAHLIKVERRTRDSATARHILLRWARTGARLDTLEARADSLDRYAAEQTNPALLDSVARWMDLPVNQGPPLIKGQPYVLGRFRIPDVGVWAFESSVGETSPVIETEGAYYVFRVDSLTPDGVPPFDQVADEVRVAVLRVKKRDAAQQIAQEAERRLATGEPMEQVANAMRLQFSTSPMFTRTSTVPVLGTATPPVGSAFRLRVGERSGVLHAGDNYVIMQPDRLVRADSTAWVAQKEQQRAAAIQQIRQVRVQQYLDGLRRAANVRDRRDVVLRPANQDLATQ